jgi:hypothetical protein
MSILSVIATGCHVGLNRLKLAFHSRTGRINDSGTVCEHNVALNQAKWQVCSCISMLHRGISRLKRALLRRVDQQDLASINLYQFVLAGSQFISSL